MYVLHAEKQPLENINQFTFSVCQNEHHRKCLSVCVFVPFFVGAASAAAMPLNQMEIEIIIIFLCALCTFCRPTIHTDSTQKDGKQYFLFIPSYLLFVM